VGKEESLALKVMFLAHGNPPVSPGLFHIVNQKTRTRIAWWPAGYAPTRGNVAAVLNEYERTGTVVGRERIRELLSEEERFEAIAHPKESA
jgi:hypothetical protein